MYELKIYRVIMCHDNEKWSEIWTGTDLSFKNWHEKFYEFWPEHSRSTEELCLTALKIDAKFGKFSQAKK